MTKTSHSLTLPKAQTPDEAVMFTCKLSRVAAYRDAEKRWTPLADDSTTSAELKLLEDRKTKTDRVLIRAVKTGEVLANHLIHPETVFKTPEESAGKTRMFWTQDWSEDRPDNPVESCLEITFDSASLAVAFQTTYVLCQKQMAEINLDRKHEWSSEARADKPSPRVKSEDEEEEGDEDENDEEGGESPAESEEEEEEKSVVRTPEKKPPATSAAEREAVWAKLQASKLNKWKCGTCSSSNPDTASACLSCEAPRPGATSQAPVAPTSQTFSFAVPAAKTPTAAAPTFSFAKPSSSSSSESMPPPPVFSFSAPATSSSSTKSNGFSFGAPSTASSSTPSANGDEKKPAAGEGTPVFSFASSTSQSGTSRSGAGAPFTFAAPTSTTSSPPFSFGSLKIGTNSTPNKSSSSDTTANSAFPASRGEVSAPHPVATNHNNNNSIFTFEPKVSSPTVKPFTYNSLGANASTQSSGASATGPFSSSSSSTSSPPAAPRSSTTPVMTANANVKPSPPPPMSLNSLAGAPAIPQARVEAFYRKYNPNKLADVPGLIEKYKGREEQLYAKLAEKYKLSSFDAALAGEGNSSEASSTPVASISNSLLAAAASRANSSSFPSSASSSLGMSQLASAQFGKTSDFFAVKAAATTPASQSSIPPPSFGGFGGGSLGTPSSSFGGGFASFGSSTSSSSSGGFGALAQQPKSGFLNEGGERRNGN